MLKVRRENPAVLKIGDIIVEGGWEFEVTHRFRPDFREGTVNLMVRDTNDGDEFEREFDLDDGPVLVKVESKRPKFKHSTDDFKKTNWG